MILVEATTTVWTGLFLVIAILNDKLIQYMCQVFQCKISLQIYYIPHTFQLRKKNNVLG